MRTVKSLRDELAKFPDHALCYAYEGEATGIVVAPVAPRDPSKADTRTRGLIVCASGEQNDAEEETRLHDLPVTA